MEKDAGPPSVVPELTPTPNEENFQEPNEVPVQPGKNWRSKLKFKWPPSKKEWVTSLIIIVLCGTGVGYALNHMGAKPVVSAKKVISQKPSNTVPSTLSGLPVSPDVNKLPVTGVMIENSPDARPQAGLGEANVVFEAIAEYGVTRFLALYQDTAPDNIGPVRSARPYYVQWNLAFDAGYAHVGGSPEALNLIKATGTRDLDQFANAGAYRRVSDRAAPHNVYTSISALNKLEAQKGYYSSTFTGFLRKPQDYRQACGLASS